MSGHNRWSQIKNKKGANDRRRAKVFTKILKGLAAAAREEQNPDFNPRLRSMIALAKENSVPNENIARAIAGAKEGKALETIVVESYGPEKVALIIEALTDNRNRTIQEIRIILQKHDAKMGEMGSARWAFEQETPGADWKPKFTQMISDAGADKLAALIDALEDQDDVQKVFENAE